MDLLTGLTPQAFQWLSHSGIKITVLLLIAALATKFGSGFIEQAIRKTATVGQRLSRHLEAQRQNTLIRIFQGLFKT